MRIKIFCILLISLLSLSCTSIQAGIYLSSVDSVDGESIKKNEPAVKSYLESILIEPENYTLRVYERNGIDYQFKRTKLIFHSFYVIGDDNNNRHTLSFYGTKIAFYSEGAWILDGDSDNQAYISYTEGGNKWDVIEIEINNGITYGKPFKIY